MRKTLWVLLVLASAQAQSSKKPDKPVTYTIDLTRPGEKRPTILTVKLPARFWQHSDHPPAWAPGTAVRRGWGTAWIVQKDYFSTYSQGHVFLEIEEMGKRKLKAAADSYRKAIPEICKKGQQTLRGKVGRLKRAKKFRLGRKKTAGYTISYKVTPQGVGGNVSDVTTALLFEVNGHLVVVTVIKFGATDYYPVVSQALSVANKWPTTPTPFKLIDLTGGVIKFLTYDIPGELRRVYRHEHGRPDAKWEQHKNGQRLARLTLAVATLDGKSLEDYVKERISRYKDHYDQVSKAKEVSVGGRKGLWLTFVDDSKEEEPAVRNVHKAFFKLHRDVWTWTYEVFGEDAKRIAAAPKQLEALLAKAVMWRSREK